MYRILTLKKCGEGNLGYSAPEDQKHVKWKEVHHAVVYAGEKYGHALIVNEQGQAVAST
jgi:hypothetical protein